MRAITALAALAGLAACDRPAPAPDAPNVVRMLATDYAFGMPDTLPAGLTTFPLVNGGHMGDQKPHVAHGMVREVVIN